VLLSPCFQGLFFQKGAGFGRSLAAAKVFFVGLR